MAEVTAILLVPNEKGDYIPKKPIQFELNGMVNSIYVVDHSTAVFEIKIRKEGEDTVTKKVPTAGLLVGTNKIEIDDKVVYFQKNMLSCSFKIEYLEALQEETES